MPKIYFKDGDFSLNFDRVVYVDAEKGSDEDNDGTKEKPFKTVSKGILRAPHSYGAVYVAAGEYEVGTEGAGLKDYGRNVTIIGEQGKTIFTIDGDLYSSRDIHCISMEGNSTLYQITFKFKGGSKRKSNYQTAIAGGIKKPINVRAFNCLFLIDCHSPSLTYSSGSGVKYVRYENCTFVTNKKWESSYSGDDTYMTNCVSVYPFLKSFPNSLDEVKLDENYRITDTELEEKSNVGVYAGKYEWNYKWNEMFVSLIKSGNKYISIKPKSTSYNPRLVASSSPSPYRARTNNSTSDYFWRVFNTDTSTGWTSNIAAEKWLELDFGKTTPITHFYAKTKSSKPTKIILQGSFDNKNYINIKTFDSIQWGSIKSPVYFLLDEEVNFRTYRLFVENKYSSTVSLETIVFEYEGNEVLVYESESKITKEEFLELGSYKIKGVDALLNSYKTVSFTEKDGEKSLSKSTVYLDDTKEIYDLLDTEIEFLTYNNFNSADVKLDIQSNYSPLDKLEGMIELIPQKIVHDRETETFSLQMKAIPKYQILKTKPVNIPNGINFIRAKQEKEIASPFTKSLFLLGEDEKWSYWSKTEEKFIKLLQEPTTEDFEKYGTLPKDFNEIDWKQINSNFPTIQLAFLLKSNYRQNSTGKIESLTINQLIPLETSSVNNFSIDLINTTAEVDVKFEGNVLQGLAIDEDETEMQYAVYLNNNKIYPIDTDWTIPRVPPFDIAVPVNVDDMFLGEENNLKIVFRDTWGTTESWTTTFIGERSGLLFYDVAGDLYSTELGKILKYLDFGVITAGQTTTEHEVVVKNKYGYDIENLQIFIEVDEENPIPAGADIQVSKSLAPFTSTRKIVYDKIIKAGEEISFYVRMTTTLDTTPNATGSFRIKVKAAKVE